RRQRNQQEGQGGEPGAQEADHPDQRQRGAATLARTSSEITTPPNELSVARKTGGRVGSATNVPSPQAGGVRPVAAVKAAIEISSNVRRPMRSAARRKGTLP